MQRKNKQKGFTLLELLIVLAIVGILTGIALPMYQNYMVKAKRADAKAALSELSVWMERQYTAKGCYSKDCANNDSPTLPFTATPKSGAANYNLTVTVTGTSPSFGTGFTLTATPTDKQKDSLCGALSLTNTGAKTISGTGTVAECW